MKKILTFIAVFVLALSSCLVGCNLISRDNKAFYSQVVSKAGNVEVTFEELYDMCNSVKYYNNISSLTHEQVKKICEDLLDKKLFLYHFSADESVQLTEKEKNYIYSEVYESINNAIYQYEQIAKWGAVLYQTRTSSEEPSRVYESYTGAVSYSFEDGFVVNQNFKALKELDYKPVFEFVSQESESIQSQARNAYFNALRENAKLVGKGNLTNNELLNMQIEKLFASYCENALVLKINYQYVKTGDGAVNALNNLIFDDFKELVTSEKETLDGKNVKNASGTEEGSIGSLKVSDVESLYAYCSSIVSQNFFKVGHILLKSETESEEIQTRLENIKTEIQAKFVAISGAITIAEVDSILNSLETEFVFTGNKTADNLDSYKDFAKECVFTSYMFKYSEDTATFTTEKDMVIPVDSSLDTMVKVFADEARRVRQHEEGEGDDKHLVNGSIYDLSNIVKTTYGYHLIIYLGSVEKIVDENFVLFDDEHEITTEEKAEFLKIISTSTLKMAHNKTVYNVLIENSIGGLKFFEEYYNTCLSYEKNVITENKLENRIYEDRIKELGV